jgi:chromosome segregation ATPase
MEIVQVHVQLEQAEGNGAEVEKGVHDLEDEIKILKGNLESVLQERNGLATVCEESDGLAVEIVKVHPQLKQAESNGAELEKDAQGLTDEIELVEGNLKSVSEDSNNIVSEMV